MFFAGLRLADALVPLFLGFSYECVMEGVAVGGLICFKLSDWSWFASGTTEAGCKKRLFKQER